MVSIGKRTKRVCELAGHLRRNWRGGRVCLFALLLVLAKSGQTQQPVSASVPDAPDPSNAQAATAQPATDSTSAGSVHGSVVDKDGAVCEGAHVELTHAAASGVNSGPAASRTATTDSNGRFNFPDVPPGPFRLTVTSSGFATKLVTGTLHAGESFEANAIVLVMNPTTSEIDVTATREEIAQEELKQEETQRVLGVIPNFYVSYVPNAPPLTRK